MFDKKRILLLFWPVFLEQTAGTLVNIFSTMMVTSISQAAVAGVGMIGTLNFLIMNAFTAVGTGVTVIIAQYIGARRQKEAGAAASQSIVVAAYIAVVAAAVMLVFDESILRFLFGEAEEAVLISAREYMRYSLYSLPLLAIFNTQAGIMRAVGNSKLPMIGSFLSNAAYLLVAYPCINMFGMGIAGAGLGLSASRLVPALFLSIFLYRGIDGIYLPRISLKLNTKVLSPVLKVALPSGVDSIIFNGGKLIVSVFLAGMGTAALAANSMVGSVSPLLLLPASAMQVIIVTIVGQSYGAKDYRATRKNMLMLTGIAMAVCLIPCAIFTPLVNQLIGMYDPTPEAAAAAYAPMLLMILTTPLWPAAFVLPSALRATGSATYTMWVSIISMFVLRVAGAWFFGVYLGWGLFGIWLSMIVDWVGRSAFFIPRAMRLKQLQLDG